MEYAVVPRLSDGLGNRLFQYAVALGLAKKWNRSVKFVRAFMLPTTHGDYNNFLKLFPDVPVEDNLEAPTVLSHSDSPFKYNEFSEVGPSAHTLLIEYRQNPRYFEGISINPVWPFVNGESALGSWMIHFRRGDYDKLPQYSVDLTKYYRRCLLAVPEGSRLRVFSDEPERCHELLETVLDGRNFEISWSTETLDIKALYEMSYCTGGAITANSTFSWWGAYFARARGNVSFQAFYPKFWGAGLADPAGIVPAWGQTVDVN
jgi:hypothetical protein